MCRVVLGLAVFILLAAVGTQAGAAPSDPAAEARKNGLLVRFAANTKHGGRKRLRSREGVVASRPFRLVRGLEHWTLPASASRRAVLGRLRGRPDVLYAEPDQLVQLWETDDPLYSLLYALENDGQTVDGTVGLAGADMNVAAAWSQQIAGTEQLIAVIDSGVEYDHPDLAANMWTNAGEIPDNGFDDDGNGYVDDVYGYDFFDDDGDPRDVDGHGTHVAGTICAVGDNGVGIVGVSRNCRIMALRFIGPNGGYTSDAIAALDYAVSMGANLSNNSWGGGGFSQALEDAIRRAAGADHIFVAAAGNSSVDSDRSPQYPASYALDNVLAVAATDNRDGLATFSNYGASSVDLGAPGVAIASAYAGGGYASLAGTSMAAPNVTGVLALMRETFPAWDYTRIIARLLSTVRPVDSLSGSTATGGVPDALAALEPVPVAPPSAPSGLLATPSGPGAVELLWTDNSTIEDGFVVERTLADETRFENIAEVGADVTSYNDSGLAAATDYAYRVSAFNAAGRSGPTAEVAVTTEEGASGKFLRVENETAVAGVVDGDFTATFETDGLVQTIAERESGGRPVNRYSFLEHRWSLVTPAGSLGIEIDASVPGSTEAEAFVFEASAGGRPFERLFTISAGAAGTYSAALQTAGGALVIRVVDTVRANGTRTIDRIAVDRIAVRVPDVEVTNQPPVAAVAVRCDGLDCSLDGTASRDPDGSLVGFEWSFGDGESATGEAVRHVYAAPGEYLVSLRVLDDAGATDLAQTSLTLGTVAPGELVGSAINEGSSWRAVVRRSDGAVLVGRFDTGDAGCSGDRCEARNRKRVSQVRFVADNGASIVVAKP